MSSESLMMDLSEGESVMEKTTIYGKQFDLDMEAGCTEAQTLVSGRIQELEAKKQDLEQRLETGFYDFKQSQQDYNAKQEAEDEIQHCQRLLDSLADKHESVLTRENKAFAKAEIERVEKQAAALVEICRREIPAASRKLALIASVLEKNKEDISEACHRAKEMGIPVSDIKDPIRKLLGDGANARDWFKALKLPMLDEAMEYFHYWPLPRMDNSLNDNPEIHRQVETLLSSDDLSKDFSTLLRQIEKREVAIRIPKENSESHVEHTYKPAWYELPLGSPERNNILKTRIAGTAKKDLGDIVKFWLGLEERRRLNSFIHLLNDNERDQVLSKLPEEDRQKYWDYLEDYEAEETAGNQLAS